MTVVNPISDPKASYSSGNSRVEIPHAVVVLGGFRFLVSSVEVSLNAHGALDTGSVTMPIHGNPDFSSLFQSAVNDGAVTALVYMGHVTTLVPGSTDVSQLSLVFQGLLDTMKPSFRKDEVTFALRSNGALLYLTKQVNTSLGEYTTDFVKKAAAATGLTPNIMLPTGSPQYKLSDVYGGDFMVGLHNVRLFDTIIKCAPFDDVDVWVSGKTLNYASPDLIPRTNIQLRYGHDLKEFDGDHSEQYNRNIKVRFITYTRSISQSHTTHAEYDADGNITYTDSTRQTTTQALFGTNGSLRETSSVNSAGNVTDTTTQTSRTGGLFNTGAVSIPSDSSAEIYDFFVGNMQPNLANDYAQKLAKQISRNEYAATFTIIPTAAIFRTLNITSRFQTFSIPYSAWNTSPKFPYFYPRRISIKFSRGQGTSSSEGLTVEVEAVNHRIAQSGV